MAAQGGSEPSMIITDIAVGSTVKMDANTSTQYIYCGKYQGNALLVREWVYDSYKKFRTSGNPDYDGSNVDSYLLNDIYPTYSTLAKEKMVDTTFSITVGDGSATSSKTITRKIFCPTSALLGTSGAITVALKVFKNTTSGNTARIATTSGGTARGYWTCDAGSAGNNVWVIGTSGSTGTASVSSSSYFVRACITLDVNTNVELIDSVYVLKE